MSLEAKIEELSRSVTLLTGDVQLLTAALKPFLEHLAANRQAPIVMSPVEILEENKRAAIIEEAHDDVSNESSTPESGSQSEPEPQTSPLTYDDVKRATNALSAAKGKEVTIAALAHFGVTRATQLVEAQWGEYIAYCKKAAA